MKNKFILIITIIFMSIGFAAISTSLIINSNIKVSENNEDFSVIFTAATLDGKDVYSSAVDDTKKTITFTSKDLMKIGDTSTLTYEVTNNSANYDAEVRVTCVPSAGTTAKYTSIKNELENNAIVVKAKESVNGTLTITLSKQSIEEVSEEYTCSLEFNAVEREELGYNGPTEWTFDYTGGEQNFIAPMSGTYKLETWGAQGGSRNGYKGGYGGYSYGNIILKRSDEVYINVGGSGSNLNGGYNGGGSRSDDSNSWVAGSGGGATHIATKSGTLATFGNNKNNILIVSGGGGGSSMSTGGVFSANGGSGGGYVGVSIQKSTGGSQTSGGLDAKGVINSSFGKGASCYNEGAGGGGLYGGGSGSHSEIGYSGAGGSGYIGNTLLTEKSMYCYNCATSTEESTKTISTTCTSATPTENCAKQGNGYARITLIK